MDWAFNTGRVSNPEWYAAMPKRIGVEVADASIDDMQRWFVCERYVRNDHSTTPSIPSATTPSRLVCNCYSTTPLIPSATTPSRLMFNHHHTTHHSFMSNYLVLLFIIFLDV